MTAREVRQPAIRDVAGPAQVELEGNVKAPKDRQFGVRDILSFAIHRWFSRGIW